MLLLGGGAVVKGMVDDNIVVAGNPAKKIRSIEEYARKWMDKHEEK